MKWRGMFFMVVLIFSGCAPQCQEAIPEPVAGEFIILPHPGDYDGSVYVSGNRIFEKKIKIEWEEVKK